MVIGLTIYKSINGFSNESLSVSSCYCWCKNRKDEWFAARNLLGGDNYY